MKFPWNRDMIGVLAALWVNKRPSLTRYFVPEALIALCELGYVEVGIKVKLTKEGRKVAALCHDLSFSKIKLEEMWEDLPGNQLQS